MLVKKSIVEKWYQTDSWVYKNFAYLFSNPLWDNDIPNGFTVCPYFWMSLFSLLIFRPFIVFPIRYSIAPIIKLIGWPAVTFDKFVFETLFPTDKYKPCIGTMLSLIILISLAGLGLISYTLIQGLIHNYTYFTSTPIGLFSFWSIATFVALLTSILIHKSLTKSKCQSLYYLFPWLALFLISAIMYFPTAIGNGSASFLQTIWESIIWAFSGIGCGIWYAIKYAGLAIWYAITYTPVPALHIPLWAYFVAIGIIGWIVGVIVEKIDNNKLISLMKDTNEPWQLERNRKAWLNLFMKILKKDTNWNKGDNFPTDGKVFEDPAYLTACIEFRTIIYRNAFEELFSEQLKQLQYKYPLLDYDKFDKVMKSTMWNTQYLFNMIGKFVKVDISGLNYTYQSFNNAITKVCAMPETHAMIDPLADSYRKKSEPTWHSKLCLQITGGIAKIVKSLFKAIHNGFVQVKTFFAYIGILLKAKKQGACPYFRFEDVNKKKS